jgi:Zn-dependent protease with chaperone function
VNFFDAQDQARRASGRLIVAYIIATSLIVAGVTAVVALALRVATTDSVSQSPAYFLSENGALLIGVAVLTALFIVGATLFKTAALSSGGGTVAQQMGGTIVPADVQDPLRRRLRNVVEEMAIASGVPVPEIYVLEEENAINAFAAGFAPGDAAVAVTRGTLELLDRDELQGVIAHEFSHILNGDMRLNIRLMGVLFGIMALGLIGRMILRGGRHARGKNAGGVVIVGLGLAILGAVGVLAARVIKAGISRQREYLADASAVQFTRQSRGIAGALKKIGGYQDHSFLVATDPEEVSHMLFGTGSKLAGMLATHPPLVDRIKALDPNFTAADFPKIDARQRRRVSEERASGFASDVTTALAGGGSAVLPDTITETVGQPDGEHVEFARELRRSIPESLYDAAHSPELAYLLTVALVLDRSGDHVERQLIVAKESLGSERARLIRQYYDELTGTGPEYRLPLLEVAFPALKLRPAPHLAHLVKLAGRLIEIDGTIDLYEYCFYRVLSVHVRQAIDPSRKQAKGRHSRTQVQKAAVNLLRLIADYGHESRREADEAFAAGIREFGSWAVHESFRPEIGQRIDTLDQSLDVLLELHSSGKQTLLKAISAIVTHDKHLAVSEAELIRVICATLDCPLPPILVFRNIQ